MSLLYGDCVYLHLYECSGEELARVVRYMPSPFYTASVVLFQLHGCVVSHHIQVIATPLLSVHNIKYSFCWILTAESI